MPGREPEAQPPAIPKGYRSHSRLWRENRYVYPVLSRRSRGLSIGVNLNLDKSCNFDCIYCQVDRRGPRSRQVIHVDRIAGELDGLLAMAADGSIWSDPLFDDVPGRLRRVNDIAFSGDGEPTLCPELSAVVDRVVTVRERHAAEAVQLVLISNASTFHLPRVGPVIEQIERAGGVVWAKLDAGTEAYHRQVARSRVPLARIVENIRSAACRRPVEVQSLFMRIDGVGPAPEEIDAYVARLREIVDGGGRIARVQIYTIARPPAEPIVGALPAEELARIAQQVRDAAALTIEQS